MNIEDDPEEEAYAAKITAAFASAMPEVRANNARLRRDIAAFFDLPVEHLPPEGKDGWSRLLATYVWTKRPEYGVANLRHMLDRKIFNEPPSK